MKILINQQDAYLLPLRTKISVYVKIPFPYSC